MNIVVLKMNGIHREKHDTTAEYQQGKVEQVHIK
jgi:hypothetical protein